MGRRARLVLGLIFAVDAIPDLGVIYAASGRLHVLMATESARALKSHLVHIHTQTADDHATCERLRDGPKAWSCVDVTRGEHRAAQLWRHLAKYTSAESECRRLHGDAPNRILKIVAIAAAPFKRNVFLDADTVPCFDLATLYTQLQATEQRGLLDLYDVLFIPARESIPRAPARLASWARAPAWVESNGGVIFWRRTPETARLFHRWLASYCRGGDDLAHFNGGDQHILSREVLSAVQRDRLLVYHLLPIWNYRSWRRHFSNKQECCSSASVSEGASSHLYITIISSCPLQVERSFYWTSAHNYRRPQHQPTPRPTADRAPRPTADRARCRPPSTSAAKGRGCRSD